MGGAATERHVQLGGGKPALTVFFQNADVDQPCGLSRGKHVRGKRIVRTVQMPRGNNRARAANALLRGLEDQPDCAVELPAQLAQQHGRADADGGMAVVPAGVHDAGQSVQNQNLELHFLHQVPACLNLRCNHPLLQKLPPHAETFDYRLLEAYPYVEYQKLPTRTDGYTTISTADQICCSYRIVVDERDTRCRIVGTTDAFSIGCRLPQAIRERYRLECVPIPEQTMRLYCITRRGGKQNAEIARYLQLLQAVLEDEASNQAIL